MRKTSLELRGEARTPYLTCTTYVVETPSPTKTNSKIKGELAGPARPSHSHCSYWVCAAHCLLVDDCILSPRDLLPHLLCVPLTWDNSEVIRVPSLVSAVRRLSSSWPFHPIFSVSARVTFPLWKGLLGCVAWTLSSIQEMLGSTVVGAW